MRRLLSMALVAASLATTLAFSATAPASAHPRCGRHWHWVPAHRDRMGRWVHGHCAPNR